MRLKWVKFDCLQKFPDDTTSDEALMEIHGEIKYMPDMAVVAIGDRWYPIAHVKAMVLFETGLSCPECGNNFLDARALGAHRSAKHGVVGARSMKHG